jgi:hypothetical protein
METVIKIDKTQQKLLILCAVCQYYSILTDKCLMTLTLPDRKFTLLQETAEQLSKTK